MKIQIKLKTVRESKGMSIRQLSYLSGVSKSQISDIENENSMPTIAILCQLAEALHVRPDELYDCIF